MNHLLYILSIDFCWMLRYPLHTPPIWVITTKGCTPLCFFGDARRWLHLSAPFGHWLSYRGSLHSSKHSLLGSHRFKDWLIERYENQSLSAQAQTVPSDHSICKMLCRSTETVWLGPTTSELNFSPCTRTLLFTTTIDVKDILSWVSYTSYTLKLSKSAVQEPQLVTGTTRCIHLKSGFFTHTHLPSFSHHQIPEERNCQDIDYDKCRHFKRSFVVFQLPWAFGAWFMEFWGK